VPNTAVTGNVTVATGGVTSNSLSFSVIQGPVITTLSPTAGTPGSTVTINGTGFGTSQGTVTFSGSQATVIPPWSATTITAAVPSGVTSGNVVVTAGTVSSIGTPFTVLQFWTQTGDLVQDRDQSTMTLLNNGKVLLAGGYDDNTGNRISTAELYDPATGIFTATGSMNIGRIGQTATLLADGQVLIAGGDGLGTAELYNPDTGTFIPVLSNMNAARGLHTANLLQNGLVVLIGGEDNEGLSIASAELYDPAAQTFTFTGSLQTSSNGHTATLLNNGKILVAGGQTWDTFQGYLEIARTEIFDPSTGTFVAGPNLGTKRSFHSATLLNSGSVLVAGGSSNFSSLQSAELYNPITSTFAAAGNMNDSRYDHTAILLSNGKVLMAGGFNPDLGMLASSELYDPLGGAFSYTDTLNTERYLHAAVLLGDEKVLVAGGVNGNGVVLNGELYQPSTFSPASLVAISLNPQSSSISGGTSQQFTATGTFSDNSTQTLAAVSWSSSNSGVATITNDAGNSGQAFGLTGGTTTISACAGAICGSGTLTVVSAPPNITSLSQQAGVPGTAITINGANFGSQQGASTVTFNGTLATPTSWHTGSIVVPVPTGAATGAIVVTVGTQTSNAVNFIVGTLNSISITPAVPAVRVASVLQLNATGTYSDGSTLDLTQAVAWNSAATSVATVGSNGIAMGVHIGQTTVQATLGSVTGSNALTVNSIFIMTGSMNNAREFHAATLLDNGKVFITGGWAFPLPKAGELYDPSTGQFSLTGNLGLPRYMHTATLLGNGLVLIVGGVGQSNPPFGNVAVTNSAELYDPVSGTFFATGCLSTARYSHTATLLSNGKVLILGGTDLADNVFASAELYDPTTGTFSPAGNMNLAREGQTATTLTNGKILISAGGGPNNSLVDTAEVYDPTTGSFALAGTPLVRGDESKATLLNDGDVLYAVGTFLVLYQNQFSSYTNLNFGTSDGGAALTLMNDGRALLTGSGVLDSALIYDPKAGIIASLGGMNSARASHTSTKLKDGSVLLTGGTDANGTVLATAEFYVPPSQNPAGLVSIAVTPGSASFATGTSRQLVATATFSDNSTQTLSSSIWTSTNDSVAAVSNDPSNNGQVYGKESGSATLTACIGTVCGSSVVTITAPAPVITGLSTSTGTVGTFVTITGSGFGALQGDSSVTFNGIPAVATRWYSGAIDVTVPAAASSGNIVVTVAGIASNGVPFTMPRVITSLSTTTASPATPITILGSNFGSNTGIVMFNGQAATTSSWSNNVIMAIVPSTASSGNVVVSNGGISSNAIPFTVGPVIYSFERTITIDHRQVPNTDQTNFPILVSGTYSYLASVANGGRVQNSNGYDVVFSTDLAGNNRLDHEIESYDPVTGTVNFWVRIPTLSHLADTVIFMHYGTPVVITSQENKAGVWDSNYQMVLHMGEPTAPYHDSTSNAYVSGGGTYPVPAQGKIGQSQFFDNTLSQYISFAPDQSPSPANAITMEAWIKTNQIPNGSAGIFGKGSNDSVSIEDSYSLEFGGSPVTVDGQLGSTDENFVGLNGANAINDNAWHHVVVSAPSTGTATIYVDGIQNQTFNNNHPLLAVVSDHFLVGTATKAANPFGSTMSGSIDEVRISNSARPADWIATEYNNQNSPAAFSSAGSENAPSLLAIAPISAEPGTPITITGNGLTGTAGTVTINGHTASISNWTDSAIVVVVPNGTTTGPLVVTAGGVQANPLSFTVLLPQISNVVPNSGDPGTTVIISGANFDPAQGNGGVTIGGLAATIVSWAPGSITARVSNGAVSGNVVVNAPYGEISNPAPFTITDTLGISFFSPSSGPVGTEVTILGGGFGASSTGAAVYFDGSAATITAWTDTQIRVIVPQTGTGPILVTVPSGSTAETSSPFVIGGNLSITDSLGNTSNYSSSIIGGAWHPSFMQGSGCSSCTIRGALNSTFDNLGNVLTNTDELGRKSVSTYDADGNVLKQTSYLDANTPVTTSYTYNSLGEPLTITDPLGNVTTNTYDANGNLLSVTTPSPDGNPAHSSETQFGYDLKGQLTLITDPLGHPTTIAYYPTGLIYTITDVESNVTTYEYNPRGNRTAVVDAAQGRTTFDYDLGNRLKTITYPDTTYVSFAYDIRGRRKSVTDQNHKITSYTYDDADRLIAVTDAAQQMTQYAYDTENNLLSITDANTHITSFAYDEFGRVKQTIFPSTLVESYVYDAVGNLTSKTDRKNQTIQYVYDALNRLSHKGYPDSTGVDYVYDLVGKLKQVTDPTGTYGFAYDNMGRLLGTTTQYSFLPGHTYSNSYGYDAASNRTSFTAPDGSTNTYAYDTLNRLTTLTNSLTGQFGFTYDNLSRRTALSRPNGVNTTYGYDSLSRLSNVLHGAGTVTVDGAGYTYDNAGNRTAKTNYLNNITEQYTYDPTYQLTQVTQGTTTTESYSYDAVGNRLSSLGMSPYVYNSSNELTSTPAATFTYDGNGNTLTKADSSGTTTYNWDFENRLASVVLPGTAGAVTFKYDPLGRRIQKSSSAATTNYLYDGSKSIVEVDQTNALVARYTQDKGIDEPLAEIRGGAIGYYDQDGLGSVTSLTGSSAAVIDLYAYDSFGSTTTSTNSLSNPFQYTGRDNDSETGLRYYRARYYDPNLGRFTSEDPTRFNGGMNFYEYADNDPVNETDPSGCGFIDCTKALAELTAAMAELARREAENAAAPQCDKGHDKAIEQAKNRVRKALAKARNCLPEEQIKKILDWINGHKRELIIGGAVVVVGGAVIILCPECAPVLLPVLPKLAPAF
jgi:RHS repeat-associated protein